MTLEAAVQEEASFFDPARHVEALAQLARSHLARNDAERAFPFIDRRCRLIVPSARDLFLRALAHRSVGRLVDARRDLADALALDPGDTLQNIAALSWAEGPARVEAAERLSTDPAAPAATRAEAVRSLFAGGRKIAHGLDRAAAGISGWICWESGSELQIRARGAGGDALFAVKPDPSHPLAASGISATDLSLREATRIDRLELTLDGEIAATPTLPQRSESPARLGSAGFAEEAAIHVIVPVYEDYEATRGCLEALMRAKVATPRRLIVVDDASPSAPLRAYLDAAAARGGLTLLRNESNLGFARSVNAALALCGPGDVLLVNADAFLPDGAIERLRETAYSAADIGTVTPFSNNGELTSYPLALTANPLPSEAEIAALDAKARRANGDAVVDMPNGVGFCLYIRQDCLEAVGPLPEVYAHGYYEDVEFCLRAAERGFRNVCAPGIFVGHAGSKSFGARKRALVVRNLALLEDRFPAHSLEVAAYLEADPLRAARAALDEQLPPGEEVVLLACGAGASKDAAERRAAQLGASPGSLSVLVCATNRAGRRVDFKRQGGGAPQSLSFDLAEPGARDRLAGYLAKLHLSRVELFDAAAIADPALRALLAAPANVALACGAFEWLGQALAPAPSPCRAAAGQELCATCAAASTARPIESAADRGARDRLRLALARADSVAPLDRMGEAFARRVFKGRTQPLETVSFAPDRDVRPPASGPRKLGILSPRPSPATDRLALRLARTLVERRSPASIVVFGEAVDALGLMALGVVFVTGRVTAQEYPDMARRYAITEIASLDRTAGFGDLDDAAAATGLAKAYFDWSFGALAVEPGDLSMDPRACVEKAVERIAFLVEYAISNLHMTTATRPKNDPVPSVRTFDAKVKRISERQIAGYVLDPGDLDTRFVVELLLDGFPARIARACLADPDLVGAGHGDGSYRFVFSLEAEVLRGARLAEVRLANTGESLGPPIDLSEETIGPDLERHGEARWIGGLRIEGWLPLREGPGGSVSAIIEGETVATARADLWSHVGDAAAGGVARGFTLVLPIALADGRLRRVRVVDPTGRDLPGSPCPVVAFPQGLERFLEGRAEIASERQRAGLFDRLIPQSLPFSDFAAWSRAFPPDPPLTGRRPRMGVALLGERGLEATLASLEQQVDCDWAVGVLGEGEEPMAFHRADLQAYLAADAAPCEILVFAPAGVVFHPYALGRLAEALDAFSGAQLAYADFAMAGAQGGDWPIALPAFDYERMLEQGYCALVFAARVAHVRDALAKGVSDFYRLFNCALDAPGTLSAHPPVHAPGFLARLPHDDFARASGRLARATSQHLEARGLVASAEPRASDLFPRAHVIRAAAPGKTSIVIPTRDRLDLLRPCVESLMETLVDVDYEIVVVDNDSADERTHAYLDTIAARGVRIARFGGPFNFARIVDAGASIARGDYLLLLNNDVEATRAGWLQEMLSRIQERDVGAVGAQLLWPGGGVQHGGVVLGQNFAATHAFDERYEGDPGYGELLSVAHECSAVTAACLLTRRRLFNDLGGFDGARFPVIFNDVDFCLRLRERGLRVVFTPYAKLVHKSSASRGHDDTFTGRHRHQRDIDNLRNIWGDALLDDPSYSPMLGLDGAPYSGLAWPARSQAPRAPRIAPARRAPPGF